MIKFLLKILGLTQFLDWVKSSFEDDKGQASFRRIAPFILNGTCVYVMVSEKLPKEDMRFAFTAMLITGAFYAGLITFQNVFQLYNAWKGINQNPEEQTDQNTQKVDLTGTITQNK